MKKIISLFQRNYEGDCFVRNEIVPGAEWVVNREGVATRKWDGTCCMIRNGQFYKRYDAKRGKTPPEGFEAAQDPDPKTGHHPGWIPVQWTPDSLYHLEAWHKYACSQLPDGTYELVGPKIQGNPDGMLHHTLITHGGVTFKDCPVTFNEIRDWLRDKQIEGIVWHHPDGRMVKIKKKDFNYDPIP